MLWHQQFWWISLHMHLPGPQIQGHFPWLSYDGCSNRFCNQADRRVDKKREGQSIFPSLQVTRLFIPLPSWNGEETFQKRVMLDWNRQKVLLIFKWKWLFIKSDFPWINIILKVLKWHSLTHFALRHLFSCSLRTDKSFRRRIHGKMPLVVYSAMYHFTLPLELWGHMRLCQQAEGTSCLAYWLSLPHLCCLFQITCGCNENNDLSNWWLFRFCSEPLGTRVTSNVIVPLVCQ